MTFVVEPWSKLIRNYVTINNLIAPWENRKISINGVKGEPTGATHTDNEEVAEYNDDDNDDDEEEVNHIEVRSDMEISL